MVNKNILGKERKFLTETSSHDDDADDDDNDDADDNDNSNDNNDDNDDDNDNDNNKQRFLVQTLQQSNSSYKQTLEKSFS